MLKDKPVISNQHGALVMAFVPFIYSLFIISPSYHHLFFGFSWLFLYFFSYPFFNLFSRKPTDRNKKWAIIYFSLSLLFALPVIYSQPTILQFIIPMIPLGLVQIYYAKKRDERHIVNDLAGIFTFGIIGLASGYLNTYIFYSEIFIHPTLFFIATTFYVKSLVRERKNPLYTKLSIGLHCILGMAYFILGFYSIAVAYVFALIRAVIIPYQKWNVKQIGLLEFLTISIFLLCLWLN